MSATSDIWAVIPVKETGGAKQRLGTAIPDALRSRFALAMLEDVLTALSSVPGLAGIAVVTLDAEATRLATRYGARIFSEGAREGQTGAVAAAAQVLEQQGRSAMLAIPGDIPLIRPEEVSRILAAHDRVPDFVIAPAHDERGSNAILCAPPRCVTLRFGDDSFLPHLEAARRAGIEPKILPMPGIGLDIDHPRDLDAFLKVPSKTRTRMLLREAGIG
jgi:2-phospho-L-lactate/phosphoenolpyruvate guanylyltransferase